MLHSVGASFGSVNVLQHPALREGVKAYSDWPTIPQLYIDGEFSGGCDIGSSFSFSFCMCLFDHKRIKICSIYPHFNHSWFWLF